jgi:hypothetical protein
MRDTVLKIYKYGDSEPMTVQLSDERFFKIKNELDALCRQKGYHYSVSQGFSMSDALDILYKDKNID